MVTPGVEEEGLEVGRLGLNYDAHIAMCVGRGGLPRVVQGSIDGIGLGRWRAHQVLVCSSTLEKHLIITSIPFTTSC